MNFNPCTQHAFVWFRSIQCYGYVLKNFKEIGHSGDVLQRFMSNGMVPNQVVRCKTGQATSHKTRISAVVTIAPTMTVTSTAAARAKYHTPKTSNASAPRSFSLGMVTPILSGQTRQALFQGWMIFQSNECIPLHDYIE